MSASLQATLCLGSLQSLGSLSSDFSPHCYFIVASKLTRPRGNVKRNLLIRACDLTFSSSLFLLSNNKSEKMSVTLHRNASSSITAPNYLLYVDRTESTKSNSWNRPIELLLSAKTFPNQHRNEKKENL